MRAHNKQFMSPVKSTGWDLRSAALHASPIIGRYMYMKTAIHFITLSTLFLVIHAHAYVDSTTYEMNCGIGKVVGKSFTITKETTDIPFISKQESPEYAFGCKVKSLQDSFKFRSEIISPETNTLSTIGELSSVSSGNRTILKSSQITLERNEITYIRLRLDDSDPSGHYIINIVTENNLSRRVTFNVYK